MPIRKLSFFFCHMPHGLQLGVIMSCFVWERITVKSFSWRVSKLLLFILNLQASGFKPLSSSPLFRALLLEEVASALWPWRPLCWGQRLPEGQLVCLSSWRWATGEFHTLLQDSPRRLWGQSSNMSCSIFTWLCFFCATHYHKWVFVL